MEGTIPVNNRTREGMHKKKSQNCFAKNMYKHECHFSTGIIIILERRIPAKTNDK